MPAHHPVIQPVRTCSAASLNDTPAPLNQPHSANSHAAPPQAHTAAMLPGSPGSTPVTQQPHLLLQLHPKQCVTSASQQHNRLNSLQRTAHAAARRIPCQLLRPAAVAASPRLLLLYSAGGFRGCTCQMSLAYSTMVRSLLNLPLPAVYMMERRVHSSTSLYTLSTSSCASR